VKAGRRFEAGSQNTWGADIPLTTNNWFDPKPTIMKIRLYTGLSTLVLSSVFLGTLPCESVSAATFLSADVSTWLGEPGGPGVHEAFLVLDWADTQPAFVWGYRWTGTGAKTGADLLGALSLADSRFTFDGLGSGFAENLAWNGERFRPGYNATSGTYWNYFVNNNQQSGNYTDGAAPTGAHILPPLGSPYDEAGPGAWVSSNTGFLGRPLVDGSWDGFVYADSSSPGPGLPRTAPAVPEAAGSLLLGLASLLLAGNRHRR
jgi:hypothetical protein